MTAGQEAKFIFTDSNTAPWQDSKLAKGVVVKNLGKANGRAMQLVRFEPGAVLPTHKHEGPEFIFMLEGEAIQNGQVLTAGWAGVAETGSADVLFRSDKGCLFLLGYAI
ncbi:anti-sigma factor ChrR (cupin superfamily) [Caballeronia udeis]|jgi:anti-sigma factor ChrR (cupin superfamily)|uniref:Anti-sigma factor ChrR (Cupin superfamily) n=1 Tax=Caballeronia udeis TaxID=1232866 RepID=A0ABW8MFT7_9BURK